MRNVNIEVYSSSGSRSCKRWAIRRGVARESREMRRDGLCGMVLIKTSCCHGNIEDSRFINSNRAREHRNSSKMTNEFTAQMITLTTCRDKRHSSGIRRWSGLVWV